ncbi:hypothetical protein B7494_g7531 [Chlorociboria aeruginascens]|nr:hypothetical protein B7494_g7531 [Chlorociboria aeruginascens]
MLSRHMGNDSEEVDFPLYPETSQLYAPQPFPFNAIPNFNLEANAAYSFPRTQEYPPTTGYHPTSMYTDIPQYALESPELRAAPSNYSTASGTSSVMGSPNSIHGHAVPLPEWAPHGLGLNPSIVGYDNFGHGSEYNNFPTPGMEEFALDFPAKPDGFVGECQNVSTSPSHGPVSNIEPLSSLSTAAPSPRAMKSSGSMSSPNTSVGAIRRGSRDQNFKSPSVSAISRSSALRRPSQALNPPNFASAAGRPHEMRSPLSAVSTKSFKSEPSAAYAYHPSPFFSQSSGNFVAPLESSYPSILHAPYSGRPASATTPSTTDGPYQTMYPTSPAPSHLSSRSPIPTKQGSQSPYLGSRYNSYPYPPPPRRASITVSHQSYESQEFSSEESKEKGRCAYPDCGKVFKDLKAHMLTHQNERPEKCPIQTCDYHIKGFARKYDKNRHTLTHYKGTMVCGFCPGSGSAAEKSFNRADVFKRHLTSVHAVEQSPPNSRKKTSAALNSGKKLSGYAPDATGKCSTCSATFSNAQDFYEHLDECVLKIVQQEEPSEAINAQRLAEVDQDHAVHETLRNNALPITSSNVYSADDDEAEEDIDDDNDDDFTLRAKTSRKVRGNRNPANGVQKSRGLTHSKGGVALTTKGRKKRKDYPSSWGCPTAQMKMKKRVMCVFDGPRRLWKDDMMLDTDYEVRMKLGDGKSYVTDLDVQTMRRAEAFHNSTPEEKGPWIADDLTGMDLEKLMEVKA